jgi:tetratricopeptide (TPR) repeat protein
MRRGADWLSEALGPALASVAFTPGLIVVGAAGAVLATLLSGDSAERFGIVAAVLILAAVAFLSYSRLRRSSRSRGYEVLEQHHEFDIARPDGSLVIHRKRLRLRYLNEVISIVDYAWGDGDLFARYSCSPGRVVDRFVSEGELWVLISLGAPRKRGDEEEITLQRTIKDGFMGAQEWVDVEALESRRITVSVVFPPGRPPLRAKFTRRAGDLFRRPSERDQPLVADEVVGERHYVKAEVRNPPREARFRLGWEWSAVQAFISHAPPDAKLADDLAAYLREYGVSVTTADDARREGRSRRRIIREAAAVIVVVGGRERADEVRAEWSAALENAYGSKPRPVALLLTRSLDEAPAALRLLPAFQVPPDPGERKELFERLRGALWSPERLAIEADAGPARPSSRSRKNVDRSIDEAGGQAPLEQRLGKDLHEFEAAVARADEMGDVPATADAAYDLGLALSRIGDYPRAIRELERAMRLAEEVPGGARFTPADVRYNLAEAYARQGEAKLAEKLAEEATKLGSSELGPYDPKVRVYRALLEDLKAERAR